MIDPNIPDTILSLPCMINSTAWENDIELVGSWSGVLLFSVKTNYLCIVTICNDRKVAIASSAKTHKVQVSVCISGKIIQISATQICRWKSLGIESQLKAVFNAAHQWKLLYSEKDQEIQIPILSMFALYQIDDLLAGSRIKNYLMTDSLSISFEKIKAGAKVNTISYPFGPRITEIFAATLSSGIVSNVCEVADGLFMVDARCLPGSEGGAVCSTDGLNTSKNLIGMIATSLFWKNEELVGFAICCSIRHIISSLVLTYPKSTFSRNFGILHASIPETDFISSETGPALLTARIEISGGWGTGVVCGARANASECHLIICTCKHVIEGTFSSSGQKIYVTVEGIRERWMGHVIFATKKCSAFDFAVLNVPVPSYHTKKVLNHLVYHSTHQNNQIFQVATCVPSKLQKGVPVNAKGYGLFDYDCQVGPTMTQGTISNIVNHAGKAVLIHSDCLLHKGNSGGALICQETGNLIGITVNHVKDQQTGVVHPDVSFSIPCGIFMPALRDYMMTGDSKVFEQLNSHHGDTLRIWKLEPSSEKVMTLRKLLCKL